MSMHNQLLDAPRKRDHGHHADPLQAFQDDQSHEQPVTRRGWSGVHTKQWPGGEKGAGGGYGGRGPMFGRGDINLLLLALIEQQPRSGHEMIHMIEEMFHGHYPASPFAVHHTLTLLQEIGYSDAAIEYDHPKRYSITDAGRTFLGENRYVVEAMAERTLHRARMVTKASASKMVHKAMHDLERALLKRNERDKTEAQHVADVLERATREIIAGVSRE